MIFCEFKRKDKSDHFIQQQKFKWNLSRAMGEKGQEMLEEEKSHLAQKINDRWDNKGELRLCH